MLHESFVANYRGGRIIVEKPLALGQGYRSPSPTPIEMSGQREGKQSLDVG